MHEVVDGTVRRRPDTVVTEEPLEIRLRWPGIPASRVAVTMRTPGADFELAVGYLLAEGTLVAGTPPRSVAYCTDVELAAEQQYNVVTVELEAPPPRHPARRTTTMASACGVCGTESLDEIHAPDAAPLPVRGRLSPHTVTTLPDALLEHQRVFSRTGALHAAGLFDFAGRLLVAREDVGRHNAVDKVLGARQLGTAGDADGFADPDLVLCASGRIGFDIVTKAVTGRVPVVVAVGGPSSLAVELAERAGITVCGFTRGERFVVYTCPDRIDGVP